MNCPRVLRTVTRQTVHTRSVKRALDPPSMSVETVDRTSAALTAVPGTCRLYGAPAWGGGLTPYLAMRRKVLPLPTQAVGGLSESRVISRPRKPEEHRWPRRWRVAEFPAGRSPARNPAGRPDFPRPALSSPARLKEVVAADVFVATWTTPATPPSSTPSSAAPNPHSTSRPASAPPARRVRTRSCPSPAPARR